METTEVVVTTPSQPSGETVASIADAAAHAAVDEVQRQAAEDEDDTRWVRDLFLESVGPLIEAQRLLTQQISDLISRVPDQAMFQTLTENYTNLLNQTTAMAERLSLIQQPAAPSAEKVAIVIDPEPVEPTPNETPERVSEERVRRIRRL